mmetsp:Transcript_7189/g.13622  ORF Transcript_7189/g.13622 Transcript_7189/m.13622 type:complete len:305 (-) Transcript_7189:171-1085(-)|eukprot:CAMPEP_0175138624 /NCGR_PEP_ID=MMETSP0087-20121206/10454_1 /TAXON_ID=136419 /ORGANISM="Unknown Unknown, Strain D1" /LENGTH=304 /DNA_ID=CAMNT_0016421551 /DNA_START=25 /DNA_END=939 /DNA_ORIENTATION=-
MEQTNHSSRSADKENVPAFVNTVPNVSNILERMISNTPMKPQKGFQDDNRQICHPKVIRARHHFLSQLEGQLSFNRGDLLLVKANSVGPWLSACHIKTNTKGLVPANYCKESTAKPELDPAVVQWALTPASSPVATAAQERDEDIVQVKPYEVVTLFPFKARNKLEMTFPPSRVLTVTAKFSDTSDWLIAREGEMDLRKMWGASSSWVPANYVLPVLDFVVAVHGFQGNPQKHQLSFDRGSPIKVFRKSKDGWWSGLVFVTAPDGTSFSRTGLFPSNLVEPFTRTAEANAQLTLDTSDDESDSS